MCKKRIKSKISKFFFILHCSSFVVFVKKGARQTHVNTKIGNKCLFCISAAGGPCQSKVVCTVRHLPESWKYSYKCTRLFVSSHYLRPNLVMYRLLIGLVLLDTPVISTLSVISTYTISIQFAADINF